MLIEFDCVFLSTDKILAVYTEGPILVVCYEGTNSVRIGYRSPCEAKAAVRRFFERVGCKPAPKCEPNPPAWSRSGFRKCSFCLNPDACFSQAACACVGRLY